MKCLTHCGTVSLQDSNDPWVSTTPMGALSPLGHFPSSKVTQGSGNAVWGISQMAQPEGLIGTMIIRVLTGLFDTVTKSKEGMQDRIG